jgi:hypothetical protein
VCGEAAGGDDPVAGVAAHLVAQAEASDALHVMWLNRNLTKERTSVEAVAALLRQWWATGRSPGPRVAR